MAALSNFFCPVTPEDWSQLDRHPNLTPVLLAYQLGPGPHLLRCCAPLALRGGWLGIHLGQPPWSEDPGFFCRQAVLECRARGARGILADWDRQESDLYSLTRQLGQALTRAGLTLAVPESYGQVSDRALVLISSALSGGSLELRLSEACQRYGKNRVVIALERMGEDFRLPCPSGQGTPLTFSQLQSLRQQFHPAVYWSGELCARYFTYRTQGQVHFVLFDDGETLAKKWELAQTLGIRHAIAPWAEISDCLDSLRV